MTRTQDLQLVQFGEHASTTDYTGIPGTKYVLRPEEGYVLNLERIKNERRRIRSDGEKTPDALGATQADFNVPHELYGLADGADGLLTDGNPESGELGRLLENALGLAVLNQGDAVTPTTHVLAQSVPGTGVLGVNDDTDWSAFGAVLFREGSVASAARKIVRFINSVGAAPALLNTGRAYAAAPDDADAIFPMAVWSSDPTAKRRVPLYFAEEDASVRKELLGCQVESLTIPFPANAAHIIATFTGRATDGNDDGALIAPANTEEAHGGNIRAGLSPFWLGATELCLFDATLTVTNRLSERGCYGGENGILGFKVMEQTFELAGKLYLGGDADEVGAALLRTLRDTVTTQDILFQFGGVETEVGAIRMPEASFTAMEVVEDGEKVAEFTAKATAGTLSGQPGFSLALG